MKKNMKKTVIASLLAVGLVAGTAFAQMDANTGQPNPQMHGNMNNGCMMNGGMRGMHGKMMGSGMMGGGMMGPGMMGMRGNMMGSGNWGMGCNGMMGGTMMQWMTPDQQQEFMNQTVDLRKQMMEKRFSYMEAMRNPSTTPRDLAKVEKEMLGLRIKMMEKMNAMPVN